MHIHKNTRLTPIQRKEVYNNYFVNLKNKNVSALLDTKIFLDSFDNDIEVTAVKKIEKRPDGIIVVHCNNLYEYLKFGYRESQPEIKKIEKFKEIFQAFSSPETITHATQLKKELPTEDQNWVTEKLNAQGSAVPVNFKDGKKSAIVIMNDTPARKYLNEDGTKRSDDQLKRYTINYERTTEHEARHVKYYEKFGRDLEKSKKALEKINPLTPFQKRKYHYNRYTKDEVLAHMENEVLENENGNTEINWKEIEKNLQKKDYRFPEIFKSREDFEEYSRIVNKLLERAEEEDNKNSSPDEIMDIIANLDVEELMTRS